MGYLLEEGESYEFEWMDAQTKLGSSKDYDYQCERQVQYMFRRWDSPFKKTHPSTLEMCQLLETFYLKTLLSMMSRICSILS
jgi:hypothetical protein